MEYIKYLLKILHLKKLSFTKNTKNIKELQIDTLLFGDYDLSNALTWTIFNYIKDKKMY
jgi:hypothetical protein